MTLRDAIIEKVRADDHVTFAELMRIEGFGKGTHSVCSGDFPNIIFWMEMSEDAATTVRELLTEGVIVAKQTALLTYMIDGVIPNMPIAKKARNYKEPHWLPIVLRPGKV